MDGNEEMRRRGWTWLDEKAQGCFYKMGPRAKEGSAINANCDIGWTLNDC